MKRWCFDIDGTICEQKDFNSHWSGYAHVKPIQDMVDFINERYEAGDYIILSTARHMASADSNLGLINARIGKITYEWLEKNKVPYHEIYFQKPFADAYIDDKSIRPNEILKLNAEGKLNELEKYLINN